MVKKTTLIRWNIFRYLCLLCTIVSGLVAIVGSGTPPKTEIHESTLPKSFYFGYNTAANGYIIIPEESSPNIKYEDYETLKRERKRKLDLQMARPEEYEKAYNEIPLGGSITICIKGFDIESVNPENFTYIAKKGEREILRENGDYCSSPAIPYGQYDMWKGFDIIYLNEPITDSLDFYIIDNISSKRNDFKIIKNN